MQNEPNAPVRKISAANIIIKPRPSSPTIRAREGAPPSRSDDAEMFGRLRRLMAGSGTNKTDQAIALITACIAEGIATPTRIIAVLGSLGLNRQHIGIRLKFGMKSDSPDYRWRRQADGTLIVVR